MYAADIHYWLVGDFTDKPVFSDDLVENQHENYRTYVLIEIGTYIRMQIIKVVLILLARESCRETSLPQLNDTAPQEYHICS